MVPAEPGLSVALRAFLSVLILSAAAFPAAAQPLWDLDELRRPPKVEWLDSDGPLRSLLYEGEPYGGRPSRVFAYYAFPEDAEGPVPGVVLVHGGGGTAFPEWAWMWARRGYAAIAMDLGGKGADRVPLADGGPDQRDKQKFDDLAEGPREAWTYHAIAAVVRAVSFLEARPEVDAERIAVTGISWGGYLTSLVSGVDPRIKAAAPVYGCGFIHRNSPWVENISGLGDGLTEQWIELFDPSSHLPNGKVPMLWVNRTNDFHYRMDNYQASYRLPRGPRTLSIVIDREHSHPDGWTPPEIEIFFDALLKGEPGLPRLDEPAVTGREVTARVEAATSLVNAELIYTRGDPTSEKSQWLSQPAALGAGRVTAMLPEPAPEAWFLLVGDERGAHVSTECRGCQR